jgi:hypothetical protein
MALFKPKPKNKLEFQKNVVDDFILSDGGRQTKIIERIVPQIEYKEVIVKEYIEKPTIHYKENTIYKDKIIKVP